MLILCIQHGIIIITCQKEENECIQVKFLNYAVLSQFNFFCIYAFFWPNQYSKTHKKMFFFQVWRRHGSYSPGQLFSLSLVEAEDGWSRISLSKAGQLIQQWWLPCNFKWLNLMQLAQWKSIPLQMHSELCKGHDETQ